MSTRVLLLAVFLGSAGCTDYNVSSKSDLGAPGDTAAEPTGGGGGDPDHDTGDTGPAGDDQDDPYEDPASVGGRVCDPSGASWVVGAYVYVSLDDDGDGVEDRRSEDTTDAGGHFLLVGLPAGTHEVHVQKGSFTAVFDVTLAWGEHLELAEGQCLDGGAVDVAVVSGEYDDIGSILGDIAVPYDAIDGVSTDDYLAFLRDPAAMSAYDIIFLNCGINFDWLSSYREVGTNLADYVRSGGSVYASDWAYFFIEAAFPDAVDWYGDDAVAGEALVGDYGTLLADVLDANMQAILGSATAELRFNLNLWAVGVQAGPGSTVLIQGDAPLWESSTVVPDSPLAIEYDDGGRVIYTAFHNEQQTTIDMDGLLREIILSL